MSDIRGDIARRIEERLEATGIAQRALAKTLDVSPETVWKWVNGKTVPSAENIPGLASALGKPIAWFFGTDEEPSAPESRFEPDLPPALAAFLAGTRVTEGERTALIDLAKRRSDGAIDYADELQALRVPAGKKVEDRSQADAPRLAPDAPRAAPIKRKR